MSETDRREGPESGRSGVGLWSANFAHSRPTITGYISNGLTPFVAVQYGLHSMCVHIPISILRERTTLRLTFPSLFASTEILTGQRYSARSFGQA